MPLREPKVKEKNSSSQRESIRLKEVHLVEAIIGIVIVLVLTAVVLAIVLMRENRRRTALTGAAADLDLTFEGRSKPAELLHPNSDWSLFNSGYSSHVWNLMRGQRADAKVEIFDFAYMTGLGRPRPVWQTVIKIESTKLDLPAFGLCPETALSRLAGTLGFHDINFDPFPRFSEAYNLLGSDEEAVRRAFTPDLLQYLKSHPGLCIEGAGNTLICYRDTARIKPEEIRSFLDTGVALYRKFLR